MYNNIVIPGSTELLGMKVDKILLHEMATA